MATGNLGPLGVRYMAIDSDGNPIPGAKLYNYVAGTSSPNLTYSDVGLTTPNTNPVIADAGGLFGPIYFGSTASYKLVLTKADGTSVWSQDNVAGGMFGEITVTAITFPATQVASAGANTLDDYEEGTFTGTLTGVSGTVTATVRYTKVGDVVNLNVPTLSGTSNATTKTLTGMPVDIRPARTKNAILAVSDNGGATAVSYATISTSGVITFYATITTTVPWTASGTAEIPGFQMTYSLA